MDALLLMCVCMGVQITVAMAILSSVFVRQKCDRVYSSPQSYCVYFGDILLCVIIILLLIPQIIVVRGRQIHSM